MAATGSREEMMEALNKARQAMARRVPTPTASTVQSSSEHDPSANVGVLQIYDAADTSLCRHARPSEAKDNRAHFFETWCKKIEVFVADPTKTTLELPPELCANDRRELHNLAEKYNLSHHSRGTGATRHLVLKKDALHYRMPDAAPANIEAIKRDPGTKESKFHLRRVKQNPEAPAGSMGAFGDETTAAMVHRLVRATDEYRRAVNVGYTQDELLAFETGESVEGILRSGGERDAQPATNADVEDPTGLCASPPRARITGGADYEARAKDSSAGEKSKAVYDEMCLRCQTRSRVDYDIQKWDCNGYCAKCTAQTIWKLVEVENSTGMRSAQRKHTREEFEKADEALPQEVQQPEEIDKDNDEDDTITVEDVVDMASMNDFSAADVNWIRRFAVHHSSKEVCCSLSTHIVFCIEFNDLLTMRIFRPFLKLQGSTDSSDEKKRTKNECGASSDGSTLTETHGAWFVWLREVKPAGVALSTLLDELAGCTPEGYDRLCVAFPNMSVYGTEASCVCLVKPGVLNMEGLQAMRQKYGEQNFRLAQELEVALAGDSKPA
ncbi:R3H domain containing protein, putative [Trypanosoma equiperdum]|uniref:R3H domain-containing protein n=2 Tax=Trypanozoon TaxID=39700 RepID=Q383A2_TRYB2|nr:hypothetical protein, conserved [Trypanosoma brucei brucei TREU927]EAN80129.1 hypothetical protein, conserved [Trypanosoma brucei brucei TREU927]SCU65789.1 R3H domain containing protein, putative [Trypanosoma equiperdum]